MFFRYKKGDIMSGERFTFFWNGPFSQWHESDFELDGVEYGCAEQLMMAEKVRLFEDEETLEMIMDTDDPQQQKKLGRLIDGFDLKVWQAEDDNYMPRCWNIVWRGNMAKFSQNPGLLEQLLATKGTVLVEASPYDRLWGIGLAEGDPGSLCRETWQGRNWLGEVLTNVREQLSSDPTPYGSSDDPRTA